LNKGKEQIYERQNRLHQTFLQAKTFTKNAYAIFCFAKRNISLVKFLKLFKRKVY